MRRKIVIASCAECPFRSHKGAFGSPAYVPCCSRSNRRELPYKTNGHEAEPTDEIPGWCALEKDDEL